MLLTGAFRPGERLTELSLVARLGASRTPVRRALALLAHEGLLEPIRSGGFRARSFALEEVWDAIELRGVLEGTAARLAAERLRTPDDLAPIRRHLQAMEELLPLQLNQYPRFLEINLRFHSALWHLSGSRVLMSALESVVKVPFTAPSGHVPLKFGAQTKTAELGQVHHRAIVEAIAARQGTRAEAVAREHAHVTRQVIEYALKDAKLAGLMPGARLIAFHAPAGGTP